jgi:hypothetical protein
MLNSRVFIPTLECLTTGDRLESRIPRRFHGLQYPKAMKQVLQGHEKWLEKVAIGKQMPIDSDDPTDQRLGFLTETWLYQLGRRRLVWCWNRSTYEQHAMWRFYGQRGVAIHSTVGVVRRALAQAGRMAVLRQLNTSTRVCRKGGSRKTLFSRCWCQNICFTHTCSKMLGFDSKKKSASCCA